MIRIPHLHAYDTDAVEMFLSMFTLGIFIEQTEVYQESLIRLCTRTRTLSECKYIASINGKYLVTQTALALPSLSKSN